MFTANNAPQTLTCPNSKTKTVELSEKCPYSELFWSAFSPIWVEHGEILDRK